MNYDTIRTNSMKIKLTVLILIIVLSIAGFAYYWYSGVVSKDKKASSVLSEIQVLREQSNHYKTTLKSISDEKNRCQVFITQKEGDFGSFEYCKKFIDWVKNVPLN
jgi:flagellar basal body-associated protein FliL